LYETARSFNVPTVSAQWLEACLQQGKLVKPDRYFVGKTYEGSPALRIKLFDLKLFLILYSIEVSKEVSNKKFKVNSDSLPIATIPKVFYEEEHPVSNVLQGVTIFVTSSVSPAVAETLHKDVVRLGGSSVYKFSAVVTHVIHQGNRLDNKEFKTSRAGANVKIVAPQWLREV